MSWGSVIKGKSASEYFKKKTVDVFDTGKGKVKIEMDMSEFGLELGRFIDENADVIAKKLAQDARATTLFQDYKGTARESSWSKKRWGSLAQKLRKSIRVRKSKFEDGGYIVVASAPHAHLVEYGHALVKNGKTIGRVAPRPFLRKAKDQNIEAARRAFGAE